jgi:GNAT superfamily N-acetyltransferase
MLEPDGKIVQLRDGSALLVRPIRPEDKDAIRSGFERMSPESRYRRFFAPVRRLTDTDLVHLTEVDHHDHEALVAFDAATREPVAAARFIRAFEPTHAQVAVTVIDDWQRRGVATAMLELLIERAREEGIERFLALVMEDNPDALKVADQLFPDHDDPRRSADGHLELEIELPAAGQPLRTSGLGRLLSAAARGAIMNPWSQLRQSIGRRRPNKTESGG